MKTDLRLAIKGAVERQSPEGARFDRTVGALAELGFPYEDVRAEIVELLNQRVITLGFDQKLYVGTP